MVVTEQNSELSPLDQIRQREADVTRRIAAARESAGRSIDRARRDATRIKHQAGEDGAREGKERYRAVLLQAKSEADAIVDQAHKLAEDIEQRGKRRLEEAVCQAVDIVIAATEYSEDS